MTFQYITRHYIAFQHIVLHHITLHCIHCTTVHCSVIVYSIRGGDSDCPERNNYSFCVALLNVDEDVIALFVIVKLDGFLLSLSTDDTNPRITNPPNPSTQPIHPTHPPNPPPL